MEDFKEDNKILIRIAVAIGIGFMTGITLLVIAAIYS